MKKALLFLASLMFVTAPAFSADDSVKDAPKKMTAAERKAEKEALIQQYDENGDGKLDAAEKAKMKEDLKKKKEEEKASKKKSRKDD
jgi:uncharacterized protein (DUF2141 family)